ncbi:hypothetical protein VITFI_CDS1886 [Vitreoscilla filiformis]|jgi:uncharacterized membrane protein (UPF0127 family)|uniref:DUF192 domain-containing protein n=1 Tax=Vitreoscilla filiformis TaxID=63 RepID=A0A221KF48_VITFI|nr:DUF192 domain-containing protein [Vitreoscilla filiformis]ASM77664.1 hypothetical protein VITFI_CDS1886 [Vitreoscilla filiformis]
MTFIKTATLRCGYALLLALAGSAQAQDDTRPQQLPTTSLSAGMHNIAAQVAHTPEQRQKGLMFRKEMASHEGMLFVFEQAGVQCFWMRNTPLPLTAAFLADDGTIVNLEDMAPQTETSHCSKRPVRLVLEMNQGWFAKRNLRPGMKLQGVIFQRLSAQQP